MYITENGAAYPDLLADGQRIEDEDRLAYLERHLFEAAGTIAAGVPLRGYFAWTLLDNFEWGFGYSRRFAASSMWTIRRSVARRRPPPTGTGMQSPGTDSENGFVPALGPGQTSSRDVRTATWLGSRVPSRYG